jgi:DNA polymerase-3 subunit alpha
MHDHGIEAQLKVNRVLPRIAKELGLGLVAANDVHFLERSHHEAHDVMICIGTGSNVADERRMKYVPELYFKSPEKCDSSSAIIPRPAITPWRSPSAATSRSNLASRSTQTIHRLMD